MSQLLAGAVNPARWRKSPDYISEAVLLHIYINNQKTILKQLLKFILIAFTMTISSLIKYESWRLDDLRIEEFQDIKIAYMRRVGKYGPENKALMELFKSYLNKKGLLKTATILGVALDNPVYTSEEAQRYDVGIVISDQDCILDLPTRNVDNGRYAIFEVEHTEKGVSDFWSNIQILTANLSVDISKPIIERYDSSKISIQLCEFCVPLI